MVWATWWGGIFFYASVVVPVASAEIGSMEQGFITQKISRIHNAFSCAFIGCLIVESLRGRSVLLSVLTASLFANVAWLLFLHRALSNDMDFVARTVPVSFYQRHSVYLWVFGLEWIQGIALVPILFGRPKNLGRSTNFEKTM